MNCTVTFQISVEIHLNIPAVQAFLNTPRGWVGGEAKGQEWLDPPTPLWPCGAMVFTGLMLCNKARASQLTNVPFECWQGDWRKNFKKKKQTITNLLDINSVFV